MSARRPPTWPVIPLALPAAVSIWAGWVGLGQLTGFGVVQLLPGIWDELRINTAVTLPIGMEAYAAYALYVWLHRGTPRRARDFARVSSIAALTLGALGQVAFHLMAASGVTSAPWPITAAVACLPVAVLGMGATLAHLLSTEDDDEPVFSNVNAAIPEHHVPAAPPAPQFRPAMSAPPVRPAGPGRPGDPPLRVVPNRPVPAAPARPDPIDPQRPAGSIPVDPHIDPPVRPDRPADRPGQSTRPDPGSRPGQRPDPATRTDPMPRPAGRSADRSGSTRKPAPKTDAQIVRALRDTATGGKPPTVYAVKQTYGIGSSRAERLLAELGERTPAGSPATNGSGRKEGTP